MSIENININNTIIINHKSITDILKVSEISMTVKAVRYMFFDNGEAKMYDCQDSKGQLWIVDRFGKYELYFANQGFKFGNKNEIKSTYKWLYEADQPPKMLLPYGTKIPFKLIENCAVDMSIGMNPPSSITYARWESVKEIDFPLCMYIETGGYVMFMSGLSIPKNKVIIK